MLGGHRRAGLAGAAILEGRAGRVGALHGQILAHGQGGGLRRSGLCGQSRRGAAAAPQGGLLPQGHAPPDQRAAHCPAFLPAPPAPRKWDTLHAKATSVMCRFSDLIGGWHSGQSQRPVLCPSPYAPRSWHPSRRIGPASRQGQRQMPPRRGAPGRRVLLAEGSWRCLCPTNEHHALSSPVSPGLFYDRATSI